MRTFRFTVKGMVQGVGFRYFVLRSARQYGLTGYVRNLSSGDVEVIVSCEGNLPDGFFVDLNNGPGYADVTDVEKEELSPRAFNSFNILP